MKLNIKAINGEQPGEVESFIENLNTAKPSLEEALGELLNIKAVCPLSGLRF